jgi:hypothetical protein
MECRPGLPSRTKDNRYDKGQTCLGGITISLVSEIEVDLSDSRLRILLFYPRLRRSVGAAAEASVFLLRSCSNIIHIHTELSHMGKLDPSWPQLKRIITCGQVLVMCCARGEIHALESAGILSRLIDLLESHTTMWPNAADAVVAYKRAAKALGESRFLEIAVTDVKGRIYLVITLLHRRCHLILLPCILW